MTTKMCDLCQATFDGKTEEEWITVKWMPGLHLSAHHRFPHFVFREYCPKCAKKMTKAGNVDFSTAPQSEGGDRYQGDFS